MFNGSIERTKPGHANFPLNSMNSFKFIQRDVQGKHKRDELTIWSSVVRASAHVSRVAAVKGANWSSCTELSVMSDLLES